MFLMVQTFNADPVVALTTTVLALKLCFTKHARPTFIRAMNIWPYESQYT